MAKRSEVLERFAALEEASGVSTARADRQQTQLATLEELLTETQGHVRTKAAAHDMQRLRQDVDAHHAAGASAERLEEAVRDLRAARRSGSGGTWRSSISRRTLCGS